MTVQVTRIQYPVGQGCFHAGQISWGNTRPNESGDFRYIYDCGSINVSALRDAISAYSAQNSLIDSLFISHLHDDHVNGIDRLLSAVKVNRVYLPYVDEVSGVLDLVEADLRGALSASLIEATMNPRSWFGRRGVSHVVRVLASPGDGPPVDDGDAGDPDVPADHRSEAASARHDVEGASALRPGVRASLEEMRSGETLRVNDAVPSVDWILVPHVDPASADRRQGFRKELRVACGLGPYERLTAGRLADALRNKANRRKLQACYEQIIAGGSRHNHNRVSMSLYSGPADLGSARSRVYTVLRRTAESAFCSNILLPVRFWPSERHAVGWIGTGDATLHKSEVRAAWKRSYSRVGKHVGTLLLPHHGSALNFHSELLDFPELELCVASAGEPSAHGHPSVAVVHEVANNGKEMLCVSQRPVSGLREEIFEVRAKG